MIYTHNILYGSDPVDPRDIHSRQPVFFLIKNIDKNQTKLERTGSNWAVLRYRIHTVVNSHCGYFRPP